MPTSSAARPARAMFAAGACLMLVATACGSGLPSSSATESSMPSTEPAPSGPAQLPGGELAAGTYTRSGFSPSVVFTVDEGWSTGSVLNGFFDIQQRSGTPQVIAVQFANVEGVAGQDGAVVPASTADEAADAVGGIEGLTILGDSESRIGGLEGRVVEVENASDAHVSILQVAPGLLGIDAERNLWISFLDTPDGVVAVMVGGPTDGWEDALATAEPVLESLAIGS